jgi:hypothetical protein
MSICFITIWERRLVWLVNETPPDIAEGGQRQS